MLREGTSVETIPTRYEPGMNKNTRQGRDNTSFFDKTETRHESGVKRTQDKVGTRHGSRQERDRVHTKKAKLGQSTGLDIGFVNQLQSPVCCPPMYPPNPTDLSPPSD